jgi:dATP pyrophosphohydrolase
MARARYQVLVIPYCIMDGQARFCVFRRNDLDIWQFIAGGGEDEDASILESAKREAFEEAGIPVTCDYSPLDTCCSIPGKQCFVVPEYAFAVKVKNTSLHLSHEHTEYGWMEYTCAHAMVKYDSNRTALWELNRRTELGLLK